MKPDFFQIKQGCYKIGINPFISGMDNKPVVRVECVNDYTHAQFVEFMNDFFKTGSVKYIDEANGTRYEADLTLIYDERTNKRELYNAFTFAFPDYSPKNFKQRTFTAWLRSYSQYSEHIAKISKTNNTEGRSNGQDWLVFKKIDKE